MTKKITNITSIGENFGIGKIIFFQDKKIKIEKKNIKKPEVDQELKKLENIFSLLKNNYQQKIKDCSSFEKDIIFSHLEILKDPIIFEEIKELIEKKLYSLENSVNFTFLKYKKIFSEMEDEYFKARALDIEDLNQVILKKIFNISEEELFDIKEDTIFVGKEFTPSQILKFPLKYTKGIVNYQGSKTSHSSIIASSRDIPVIILGKNVKLNSNINKSMGIIDAKEKIFYINPSEKLINKYLDLLKHKKVFEKKIQSYLYKKAVTLDNFSCNIELNLGNSSDDELKKIEQLSPDGVGLYRSEFLYMEQSDWPSEEVQFQSYKKVVEKLNNKICVIRTLDIGGDKNLKYFSFEKEENPFLGVRAIRFCLNHKKIFQSQIRALLRSSVYGNLAIMIPMVSNIEELKKAKKIIFKEKNIIEKEINKKIKFTLGIMVEVPSVAINPKPFFKEIDFFSIGTNDLTQYTLAVDRTNNKLNNLYETLNPSVLKLVKNVLDLQKKSMFKDKWIGVCGQAASETLFIPIALGLGLKNFSVSVSRFLYTKYLICNLNQKDCEKLAKKCIALNSQKQIEKKVTLFLKSLKLL